MVMWAEPQIIAPVYVDSRKHSALRSIRILGVGKHMCITGKVNNVPRLSAKRRSSSTISGIFDYVRECISTRCYLLIVSIEPIVCMCIVCIHIAMAHAIPILPSTEFDRRDNLNTNDCIHTPRSTSISFLFVLPLAQNTDWSARIDCS